MPVYTHSPSFGQEWGPLNIPGIVDTFLRHTGHRIAMHVEYCIVKGC